jgi:uroporphyrinogen-III decarboxylase
MHPEIYRKVIIPRYAELWKPLHAAGKKVLFCSDANFMELAGDIVEAGADGLIFEPCNEFDWMAERFGSSTVLVGSAVDCRDMAFRDWETVRKSMDRTFALARKCKGLIFAVGNHIPANVPDDVLDKYIEYLRANWRR